MLVKYAYYKINGYFFEIGYIDDYVISVEIVEKSVHDNNKSFISDKVSKQLQEYFEGKRKSFNFKYKLFGTKFQVKVWNYLLTIPYGKTKSYKDVAIGINCPKAYRAVGNANNKNPIIIAIPCHRVVKSNNQIGGYALGTKIKNDLLNIEKINIQNKRTRI